MEVRCRICLGSSPEKDVFKTKIKSNGVSVTCHDFMTKVFALSVNIGDGLPTKVCQKCYTKLSSTYKFKSLAEKSYLLLLDSILKRDEKQATPRIEAEDAVILEGEEKFDPDFQYDDSVPIKTENPIDYEMDDDCDIQLSSEDIENIPLIEFIKKESQKPDSSSSSDIDKPSPKRKHLKHSMHVLRKSGSSKDGSKGLKPKVCDLCGKQVHNLQEHMKCHGVKSKLFLCKLCPKTFRTYSGRSKHANVEHLGQLYYCEICKKHYSRGTEHKRLKHSTVPKMYDCNLCELKFRTQSLLKFHLTSHTKEKPFLCPVCGKAFRSKTLCTYHKRRMHDKEKKFVCHMCSKGFFSKGHLDEHIRRHMKVRNHKCDECNKFFSNRQALLVHQKRHAGLRMVNCTLCDKSFFTKGCLSIHMVTHTKEKKYECKYCGTKFGRSDHRNRHERTAHENGTLTKKSEIFLKPGNYN